MRFRRSRYLAPLVVLAVAAVAFTFLITSGGDNSPGTPTRAAGPPGDNGAPRGNLPTLPPTGSPPVARFPLTLRRTDGKEVVLRAAPRRIVSLSAGATEILFAIGAGGQVAGIDPGSDFPVDVKNLPHVDLKAGGVPAVGSLSPDLVLVGGGDAHAAAALDALSVPVLTLVEPATISEVLTQIQFFGDITGRLVDAQRVAVGIRRRVDGVQRRVSRIAQGPRVYIELDRDLDSATQGTLTGDLLTVLKAQNVAGAGTDFFPRLSTEAIAAKDPQVIVIAASGGAATPAEVMSRADWSRISAVKDGRMTIIDLALLTRPGPRIAEGLLALEEALYPGATAGSATPQR